MLLGRAVARGACRQGHVILVVRGGSRRGRCCLLLARRSQDLVHPSSSASLASPPLTQRHGRNAARALSSLPSAEREGAHHHDGEGPLWSSRAAKWGALGVLLALGAGSLAALEAGRISTPPEGIEIDSSSSVTQPHDVEGGAGTKKNVAEEYKLARQNTSRTVKHHYQYVIIGAGTTAYAAIETIFNHDPEADILIISEEASLPQPDIFRHHSLSTALLHSYNEWRRHITSKLESEPDAYSSAPMTVLLNQEKSIRLDIDKQRVLMEDGTFVTYDKCLIATAGVPRGLWAVDRRKMAYSLRDRINTCSTIYDFEQLDNLHNTMSNKHVAVVGGGFLGTELALALSVRARESGMTVSQIFAEKAPLSRYIPLYLALHTQRLLHTAGVRCIAERLVTDVKEGGDESGGALRMNLMGWNKETLYTDYAVLAPTHVDPSVDVALRSNLEVDMVSGGIAVNQQLEAVSNVFVAGGVASYFDAALGRRRVEMFDHSINSGILAGYNMTRNHSQKRRYVHQPMFRSQMKDIDVICCGLGEINSKLRTVGIWVNNRRENDEDEIDYQRGIIYYMEDNHIKGILLWNASDYLERAREVLRTQPTVTGVASLKRQIALAPDNWLRVIETDAVNK